MYYLIFPWAESNLMEFWREHPLPGYHRFGSWFMKQCAGIARGLLSIHRPANAGLGTVNRLKPLDAWMQQQYGRHGDIKPENILWFKEPPLGTLKISDFGLTRFHRLGAESHTNAAMVAMSPTYRPPETDIGRNLNQLFDIWTLGCLYADFATWMLLGWQGVESFSDNRFRDGEEHGLIIDDKFFVLVKEPSGNTSATVKPSVIKVRVSTRVSPIVS